MNHIRQLHKEAMALAEMAFIARLEGDLEQAIQFSRRAYEGEAQAARLLSKAGATEPTRSVFYRSAASFALNCNELREAERLIAEGLAGDPPAEIAEELRDLYEKVNFQRHLDLQGVSLESDEVQMVLAGNAIAGGVALMPEFVKRLEDIQSLVYRTVERKMKKPYRSSGPMSRDVCDYETYVSVPRAASFAVSLRISHPKQLSLPFTNLDPPDVIDEILDCLTLFHNSDRKVLQEKISERAYYNNFVTTASDIVPDGNEINLVGFTTIRNGKERRLELTKTLDEIELPFVEQADEELDGKDEVRTITGILRRADATHSEKQTIKLVEGRKSYAIILEEGELDDIVTRLWNKTISMEVLFADGNIYYRRLL